MGSRANISKISVPDGMENQVLLASRMVREHYFPNRSKNFPDWILIFAALELLQANSSITPLQTVEMMMSPAEIDSCGMRRDIHSAIAACRNYKAELNWSEGVFTGSKRYGFEKLGAMAAYLAARGPKFCRRKMNMLLFYADFAQYYLHNSSISGSKYVRLCDTTTHENFDRTVESLVSKGVVSINKTAGKKEVITPLSESIIENLTVLEITTLHWVISTFGKMSCKEMSAQFGGEHAHRFTRRGDFVAYEYARLFRQLPEPSAT